MIVTGIKVHITLITIYLDVTYQLIQVKLFIITIHNSYVTLIHFLITYLLCYWQYIAQTLCRQAAMIPVRDIYSFDKKDLTHPDMAGDNDNCIIRDICYADFEQGRNSMMSA